MTSYEGVSDCAGTEKNRADGLSIGSVRIFAVLNLSYLTIASISFMIFFASSSAFSLVEASE